MKNIYSNLYRKKEKRLNLVNNSRIMIMVQLVNKLNLKNKNILDIGCYDGTFLSLIKNRNNNFYGIEASAYGVREAQKRGIKVKKFFWDDKKRLPFKDNFFDLVVAGEFIEHIYDTDFFLEEVRRLLKDRGYFLLSTPNIASLGRRLMLFFGTNPIIEVSPNEPDSSGHIRYFTFKTLESLLRKHSFEILVKKSDVVNFSYSGKLRLKLLAKLFPTLGQSLIFKCKKIL